MLFQARNCDRLCILPTPIGLIHSLTQLHSSHSQHPIIIVGDLNVREREFLGSPYTSSAGTVVHKFCETFGLL